MDAINVYEKPWYERLAGFDFEVTAYDWLLVIIDKQTKEQFYFHNDYNGVEDFFYEHPYYIYVGFNNKHYDNYIIKGLLNHYTPEEIKRINDWIIVEHNDGWTYPFDDPYIKIPPTTDLMLDLLGISLKECEGYMCMDIQESTIDFNIDHKWTKAEFDEMLKYCIHDVEATIRLIEERMTYLESKATLGEMCGLTVEKALYKTNAQLAAIALEAKKTEHNDYHNYVIPPEVDKELIPQSILDFIDRFQSVKENEIREDNEKLKWVGDIVGTEHKIGLGGIHAAKKNYFEESNEKRIIVDFDVHSYYPSLMIEYDYLSRNIKDKQLYVDYYLKRIEAKQSGDKKTASGLKLVLNTTYGASLQKFNDLYDPLMGVSTCLTGQLLLTQLLILLQKEIKSFIHIQSNTDGVMFSLDRDELPHAREVVDGWSERTRLGMGEIQIKRVIQKDVNNYLIENAEGEIEVKGGYVSDYPNGSFKHNSMSIVATAIVKYFTESVAVEDTILSCNDPFKFQLITKTGSSYNLGSIHYVDGKEVKVQKVNRVYAVRDERYGVVKKGKKTYLTLDEDGERRYYINQKGKRSYKKKWETDEGGDFFIQKDTTQNCPEHAYIDNSNTITIDTIDKEWYINLAKKRINDFLGIKETKGGKKKMATKKKEEMVETPHATNPMFICDEKGMIVLNEVPARVQLYKKIFQVGEILRGMRWDFDGYNDHQDFEYIKSHTYRARLGQACSQVGMNYKQSVCNQTFEELKSTKNMNLTTVYGNVSLIDIETGLAETYPVMAQGADNMDKGIYKAETMLIKYFVLDNFLLPEQSTEIDPEAADKEKAVAVAKSAVKREEAVEQVVKESNATKEFLEEMKAAIEKVRTSNPTYGQKTVDSIEDALSGKTPMTKTDAVRKMTKIEDKLSALGLD